MLFNLNFCVFFGVVLCGVNSARILGVFHVPAYSHFQLGDVIFRELATRGHEVTVVTPYELKEPVKNLKHVVLTGFQEMIQDIQAKFFSTDGPRFPVSLVTFSAMAHYFTEITLNHTNVQKLLKSNEQFDLVIYELFGNEAFTGFGHHYNAPSVLVSTQGASQWTNSKMGNPHNPAIIPDFSLGYTSDMTFLQRTWNTFVYVISELLSHLWMIPKHNALLQKYFPGAPSLDLLNYNTSLMLLNSHVSTHDPLPLVPNMIQIGGYHVRPPKALPKDLQDYLDGAKEGVVFFSMGSNLKSKDMPEERRKHILTALGKLKHEVLWKWEEEVLPGQPPNVKLSKWLPQQDILAHPNVKLFMTHGGLLSTIESVYHGVPILGLPVFGDQVLNIANAKSEGYGNGLPFQQVTETELTKLLNEILNNPKYAQTAKAKSKLMHDRPTKPLDTAIYWIEYVLRHKGAPHLRTAALDLTWYQILLLDVVAAIVFIIVGVPYVLYKLVTLLCCGKKRKTISKEKKKN